MHYYAFYLILKANPIAKMDNSSLLCSCCWIAEGKVMKMTWILLSGLTRELQSGVVLLTWG